MSTDVAADVEELSSKPFATSDTTTPSTSTSTLIPTLPLTYTPTNTTPNSTTKPQQLPLPHPLPPPPTSTPLPPPPTPTPPTTETEHQLLDRWAFALANWVIPRWDQPIRELDGWRTVCGMHGGFVRDCSLSVFVLLGAGEEMPYTVYRELDNGNEETIEPAVSWMRDLRARRLLQSALAPSLLPSLSPPPII